MTFIVVKIIIGLFIWLLLPNLIFQKKSKKRTPYRKFTFIVCAIIGILIIVYGVKDLIEMVLEL